MLALILLFRNGSTCEKFSSMMHVSPPTVTSLIEREGLILHSTLAEEWFTNRPPPECNMSDGDRFCLIGDSKTFECYRPKVSFNEAKVYWDGKNCIYGLKKLVLVQAVPPHYARFVDTYKVASSHDYQNLKKYSHNIARWLGPNPQYSTLFDSAYIGPAEDTPGINRVALKKKSTVREQERARQAHLAARRVVVEQFFGRLTSLFPIARNKYIWDHSLFDLIIDICILLTNEHIKFRQLSEEDGTFFQQIKMKLKQQKDDLEAKVFAQRNRAKNAKNIRRNLSRLGRLNN